MKDKNKILKATREKQQITYKGTLIRLLADFSTETLQARREWHDILKVMREEPTTKNTLPSKILLQIWWRNKKVSRQAKVKRTQHYQTSFTINPKGTSLSRKQEKDKTYLQKLNLIKKMVNRASLRAHLVKNLPAVQETTVRFLVWEDLLKKG